MNMKKILAAVGIAGSVFAGLMGSGTGVAHATPESFMACLNGYHVNSYGHDTVWWVKLSHAINVDLDRGVLPSDIGNMLQQKVGMSSHDAESTVDCAMYSPA